MGERARELPGLKYLALVCGMWQPECQSTVKRQKLALRLWWPIKVVQLCIAALTAAMK